MREATHSRRSTAELFRRCLNDFCLVNELFLMDMRRASAVFWAARLSLDFLSPKT